MLYKKCQIKIFIIIFKSLFKENNTICFHREYILDTYFYLSIGKLF